MLILKISLSIIISLSLSLSQGQAQNRLESRFSNDTTYVGSGDYITDVSLDTFALNEQAGAMSISGGVFNVSDQTTPVSNMYFISDSSFARSIGLILLGQFVFSGSLTNGPSGNPGSLFGFSDAASGTAYSNGYGSAFGVDFAGNLELHGAGGDEIKQLDCNETIAVDSTYQFALILGGAKGAKDSIYYRDANQDSTAYTWGQTLFIKRESGNWLYQGHSDRQNDATLYPYLINWDNNFTNDDWIIPTNSKWNADLLLPEHYAIFSGTNGTALGSINPEVGNNYHWIEDSWEIQSNRLRNTGTGTGTTKWAAVCSTASADVYAEALWKFNGGSGGFIFRFNEADTSYIVCMATDYNSLLRIFKYENRTLTQLASAALSISGTIDLTMRAEVIDSTIHFWAVYSFTEVHLTATSTLNQNIPVHGFNSWSVGSEISHYWIKPVGTSDDYSALDQLFTSSKLSIRRRGKHRMKGR